MKNTEVKRKTGKQVDNWKWLMMVVFLVLQYAMAHAQAADKAVASAVSEEFISHVYRSGINDEEGRKAYAKLKAMPREQLILNLRQLLKRPTQERDYALNTAVLMEAHELTPDVVDLMKDQVEWPVPHTLNRLAQKESYSFLSEVYKKQLTQQKSAPTRMALIHGLGSMGQKVSQTEFNSWLVDQSYGIREIAAAYLFQTFSLYTRDEQRERLKKCLSVSPYQVRLQAQIFFRDLKASDQAALKGLFTKELCLREENSEVKQICLKNLQRSGLKKAKSNS